MLFYFLFYVFLKNLIGNAVSILILLSSVIACISGFIYYQERIFFSLYELLTYISFSSPYLEDKLNAHGLSSALMGQRDILISYSAEMIKNDYSLFDLFFGIGIENYMQALQIYRGSGGPTLAENDFIDIFASYGIYGLFFVIYFLFVFFKLKNLFLREHIAIYDKVIIFQGFLVIVSALLSGHTLLYTFPALIIALTLSLSYDKSNKKCLT